MGGALFSVLQGSQEDTFSVIIYAPFYNAHMRAQNLNVYHYRQSENTL